MDNSLVVDFRIAASAQDQIFNENFRWPVPQNDYDDTLLRFVTWVQQLPSELGFDGQELSAFQIAEPDLLKDICSIVGTWIDVCAAKTNGLTVSAGEDQVLYRMMLANSYPEFSPTTEMRRAAESSANSPLRRFARSARESISGLLGTSSSDSYLLSGNELTREISPKDAYPIKKTYRQIAAARKRGKPPTRVVEIAKAIHSKLSELLSETDYALEPNISGYVSRSILEVLSSGWKDADFQLDFRPKANSTVFTGTGGGYVARVITNALNKADIKVNRSTHGGDTSLFDDPLWPSLEIPFATTYSTYGPKAAQRVANVASGFSETRRIDVPEVVSRGSAFHQHIVDGAAPADARSNVYVVSASFNKLHRAIPNIKIHDVVYYEWHRRLLDEITAMGFNVSSKRHPKGTSPDLRIFDGTGAREMIGVGMADTFNEADVYVLDIAGSAFIEAMCTLKPVVLIDIPNRRMTDEARKDISDSAQIVRANYSERNTIEVDREQIRAAINAPIDISERLKFIEAYLTGRPDN